LVSLRKKERIISYAASLANGKIAEREEAAFVELLEECRHDFRPGRKTGRAVTTI